MSAILNVSRRGFLKAGAMITGGLMLAVFVPELGPAAPSASSAGEGFECNAFVRIGTDDTVTVLANHSEMGQGTYTALSMLVAEELDADWSKVKVESAPADPKYAHPLYGMQMTGGSSSANSEFGPLRKVGASARAMLIAAAATEWGVDVGSCKTENGVVLHLGTNRKLSYGKLAEAASKLTPPENVSLKDPKDFKLIGKPVKRLDTPSKTNGTAMFGLDVTVPGMLVALIERPPVFGAKVKSFDDSAAKAVKGVRHVVRIDHGIAVVAAGFWPAKLGREALKVEWDEGPIASMDSVKQFESYAELGRRSDGVVAKSVGDAGGALAASTSRVEASYELPFLPHSPMEPLNCVADVRPDSCEIWTGTQFQTPDRAKTAEALGLPLEKVTIHTMLLGGGFGRRANLESDFVLEAVMLSKAIQKPVKVMWTREDDIRGGHYRPAALHAMTGALDSSGNIDAWQHRAVVQSFVEGTMFESFGLMKDGLDVLAVEGADDIPYSIPNIRVDWHKASRITSTQHWRSVGHSHTAFAVECFIDELAHAAGKDPYEFRRPMLENHPRWKKTLELVADKAGWGRPAAKGIGRGIAVHESFGSVVAQVAEVSVGKDGKINVHRIVCAIDCGQTVNPDSIVAQMEGCVVYGLSAALYGEVTFKNGRVQQRNFHDYQMLRINEMPVVEVHIAQSTEPMGGVGEPGVPPLAPAVANAIFAATGKRLRKLPFSTKELV